MKQYPWHDRCGVITSRQESLPATSHILSMKAGLPFSLETDRAAICRATAMAVAEMTVLHMFHIERTLIIQVSFRHEHYKAQRQTVLDTIDFPLSVTLGSF